MILFFLEADAPFLIVLNVTVMYFDLPRLSTVSDSLSHLKLERSEGTNLLSDHFMCVSLYFLDFSVISC